MTVRTAQKKLLSSGDLKEKLLVNQQVRYIYAAEAMTHTILVKDDGAFTAGCSSSWRCNFFVPVLSLINVKNLKL